jgi:hypothetical protein
MVSDPKVKHWLTSFTSALYENPQRKSQFEIDILIRYTVDKFHVRHNKKLFYPLQCFDNVIIVSQNSQIK